MDQCVYSAGFSARKKKTPEKRVRLWSEGTQSGEGGAFHLNMVQSVCVCVCVRVATQEDELRRLREAVEAADQNRPPLRAIHGYSILDHLGSGAFGSVFKVQAQVIQWADIVAVCFPFQ